jgi:hypothetical protein
MANSGNGLLIQGDFRPARQSRRLRVMNRILQILLGISAIATLVVYALNVHYEMHINEVGLKTRQLNEANKELLVKLNQIQSFQNVEHAAEQVPQLQLPNEVIEVMAKPEHTLSEMPQRQGVLPRATGY